MITGDKPNTAISIGRSTGIIDPKTRDNHIIKLDLEGRSRDVKTVASFMKDSINRIQQEETTPFCLCVTGNMFSFITTRGEEEIEGEEKENLVSLLVKLAMKVNSVIFCRVFPKQKVRSIFYRLFSYVFMISRQK